MKAIDRRVVAIARSLRQLALVQGVHDRTYLDRSQRNSDKKLMFLSVGALNSALLSYVGRLTKRI
jgi:hypothetical protein